MERVRRGSWYPGDGAQHFRGSGAAGSAHHFPNDVGGHVGIRLDAARLGSGDKLHEHISPELPFKCKKGTLKQASVSPIKKLIAKEMTKETESKRNSPSVIARLMGLDVLPARSSNRDEKNELVRNQQEQYQEKHVLNNNYVSEDPQEYKDIYEVSETLKLDRHNNQLVQKTHTSSRLEEEKPSFMCEKLMDVGRLSMDEILHHSGDFHDASEVLESNKDLFLKILQEPDPLFMKHLHDLQTPSRSSCLTVLKSSKKSMKKSNTVISRKENDEYVNLKKHVCPSHRYSKLPMEGKAATCSFPTRIVVLKPSLDKVQDSAEVISSLSSKEGSYSTFRKHRELGRSASRDSFPDLRSRKKLPHIVGFPRHNPKDSREIAKLITETLRKKAESGFTSDESSSGEKWPSERGHASSTRNLRYNSKICNSASRDFWDCDASSPSSCSSSETYLSEVARRHLSDRWKTIHGVQEGRSASKASNTLCEMFALSDKEFRSESFNSTVGQNVSGGKLLGPCPLGISSRDGWKDFYSSNLSKSRSLPASSSINRSPKTSVTLRAFNKDKSSIKEMANVSNRKSLRESCISNNKSPSSRSRRLSNRDSHSTHSFQNDFSIDDFSLNIDELRNRSKIIDPYEKKLLYPEPSVDGSSDREDCEVEATEYKEKISSQPEQSQFPESTSCGDNLSNSSVCISDETDSVMEEVPNPHCYATDSEPQATSNEAEQPSPVSVLGPSFDDEISSSHCFERVSADLSELRMQLQLLKLESGEASMDTSQLTLSSEEETEKLSECLMKQRGASSTSDCNRDFSFLLDVLNTSGLDASDQEMLFGTCSSLAFPIGPSVFKELEKKYIEQPAWIMPERKLLFDRINCALAEILGEWMEERPWAKTKVWMAQPGWTTQALAEEVWRLLAAHGKNSNRDRPERDLVKDIKWMETTEDVDSIGKEVVGFLMNELIEEIVSEFTLLR